MGHTMLVYCGCQILRFSKVVVKLLVRCRIALEACVSFSDNSLSDSRRSGVSLLLRESVQKELRNQSTVVPA